MEIGYRNFFFLRAKVAELFDKNVWQQYIKIMEIPYGDDRKQALEKCWVYNFPAGLIDPGEEPQQSACRELLEETGLELYRVDDMIGTSYSAVGFSNETNVCIVGKARGEFKESTSTFEEITPGWYTKAEVRELLKKYKFAARTQAFCYVWSRK